MFKNILPFMQKIGKALMLPVAVLPVAGLMLAIGSALVAHSPNGAVLVVATLMKGAGDVIFTNLALIFAIGVALGFTENDGVAGIAATVGFLVLLASMGGMAVALHVKTVLIMGIPSMETGVFGGILAGGLAAYLFNRFYRIKLPNYLAFFAGKRFVPIVTAIAAIFMGVLLALVWPFVQSGIDRFSHWAAVGDPRSAATVYGFVERLLLPFGLHHVWNVPFFFEIGTYKAANGQIVHGDIARFFAGDRTAGILAGAFLFKMFGLPGAAVAMWRAAKPEHRAAVGSLMISAALTSFLTGITEPIEFSFMFVAPLLYLFHAVLAASTQFLANSFHIHMGFTFSQGGLDFLLCNVINPDAQRWWLILVFGPVYFAVYYFLFTWSINFFHLKTPGREDDDAAAAMVPVEKDQFSKELVLAFGGRHNITGLDACITRLRVTVAEPGQVATDRLKALGATAVVHAGDCIQAIFGPQSENMKTDLEIYLKTAGPEADGPLPGAAAKASSEAAAPAPAPAPAPAAPSVGSEQQAGLIRTALGGKANIKELAAVAATRIRVRLVDGSKLDAGALAMAGVMAVQLLANGEQDLLVGLGAKDLASYLA